jgi:hypothetical protein
MCAPSREGQQFIKFAPDPGEPQTVLDSPRRAFGAGRKTAEAIWRTADASKTSPEPAEHVNVPALQQSSTTPHGASGSLWHPRERRARQCSPKALACTNRRYRTCGRSVIAGSGECQVSWRETTACPQLHEAGTRNQEATRSGRSKGWLSHTPGKIHLGESKRGVGSLWSKETKPSQFSRAGRILESSELSEAGDSRLRLHQIGLVSSNYRVKL